MVNTPKSKILTIKGERLVYGEDVEIQITKSSFSTWDIYVKNREIGKFWMLYCTTKPEAVRVYKSVLAFYGRVVHSSNVSI